MNTLSAMREAAAAAGDPRISGAKSATAAMRKLAELDQATFDAACEMAESATFTTRRYGRTFYCYATVAGTTIRDPWPASRWPKSVLSYEAARILLLEDAKATA